MSSGEAAIEQARRVRPDVILMDINMPGMDGIAAAKPLRPTSWIRSSCSPALKRISSLKPSAPDPWAICSDLEDTDIGSFQQKGQKPLLSGLENQILQEFRTQQADETAISQESLLNERQLEVLELVAQGLDYSEVGRRLFISERTVKYHMDKIKEVLQLANQAQVVAWAWQHGLGKSSPKA